MQKPVISVIVPIYNVENWLSACVDSLLAQDFTDFELILVDDGSPDGCGSICDAYHKQDSRVRVIHQPNGGLSAARNSGINIARGEYIAFVDSDDLVAPDYLSCMLKAAQASGADLVICGVEDVTEAGESLPQPDFSLPEQEGVFAGRELLSCFFCPHSTYYTVAWNKLYKAELWRSLRYPEGMIHEDDAVAHLLYSSCEKVVCLAKPLYFYRLRQGSIIRTAPGPGSFDGVSAHAAWCRFFAQGNFDRALLDQALKGCWLLYLSLCSKACAAPLAWPLCARWAGAQYEMRQLLPLLKGCRSLTVRQKLSCKIWACKSLPLPPAGEKERVALLLPEGLPVPAVQGGAVETLAEHLIRQNEIHKKLELTVVCQYDTDAAALCGRYKNTLFHYQKPMGPSLLHSIKYRLSPLLGKPIHWNRWYSACLPFLKKLHADLYVGEGGDLTGWQQASRVLGRDKFCAHLHGETPGSSSLDRIYSRAIAISDFIAGVWQGDSTRKTAIVPNCVNTRLFCPADAQDAPRLAELKAYLGFAPDDFVVIFCGRICPEKGIHQLTKAMTHISDPAVKLLVVGSPFFGAESSSPYFDALKADAKALGERIKFTGFVPNDRLPDYYRMADAACFPALWEEPAGITAIEAMACGCPVIATRSGGMPEYLDGSQAILAERSEIWKAGKLYPVDVPVPTHEALAQAITLLQQDDFLRRTMKKCGSEAALRYSAAHYYEKMLTSL